MLLFIFLVIIDEKIHLYLAEHITFTERELDEDEFLTVEKIPLDVLVDMICKGEIADGKTQAAVLKVAQILKMRGDK